MRKRKAWRAGILSAVMALSLAVSCPVSAASILEDAGITETEESYAEDTAYSMLRSSNLNYGTTGIKKISSNEIGIYGISQCHHVCDMVYLDLYLERKVDGSYATYKYWEFTKSNASELTKSINVIVPRGYYYRVRGYHAAKDGSKESVTTLTKGILVK